MTALLQVLNKLPRNWGILALMLLALLIPVISWQRLGSISTQQFASKTEPESSPSPSVDRVRVAALGRIEPVSGVIRVGGPVNEVLQALSVKEGDWVKAGQVIGYLRSYPERQAELEKAQQDLKTAQSRLIADAEYSRAQVQEREIDSLKAPAAQDSAIAAQNAQIDALRSEEALALKDLERYGALVAQGAAPQRELDQRQSQVNLLEKRIQQAQETLQQLINARNRELANLRAQVTTADANADRILANSNVAIAQKAVELAQVRVDNTLIKAPSTGQILRIVTKPGESIGDDGRGKGTVVELADTNAMQVIAEVNESDIGVVKLGQSATVVSRNKAFSDSLKGQVTEIGRQIGKNNILNDDPSALSDARVVQVKIRLESSEAIAKLTNLQVDVQIGIAPTSSM